MRFNTDADENCNKNFCSLIKNNDGLFKSQAQSSFIFGGKLIQPWVERVDPQRKINVIELSKLSQAQCGVPLEHGQDIITVYASMAWASYGKSVRPIMWKYVVDIFGIVAQYKMHFTDSDSGPSVNPRKTELLWFRQKTELPSFKHPGVYAAEKLAVRIQENEHTDFIGNVKDRLIFEGVIKSIKSFGYNQFGFQYCESFRTTIMVGVNTVIYWAAFHDVKEGDSIKFKATVKDHTVYEGVKQTVVNRPTMIMDKK